MNRCTPTRLFRLQSQIVGFVLAASLGTPLLHGSHAGPSTDSGEIVRLTNQPKWLTTRRVRKIVAKMENKLEWDLRRIRMTFYDSPVAFEKKFTHPEILGLTVLADQSVHMGPRVTTANFDAVFAHELVHVILRQKYRTAIPRWIEEGLANHLADHGRLGPTEYLELASIPKYPAIRTLAHPFKSPLPIVQHYRYSRAALVYIGTKCPLTELIQLSVGKKLENYLSTFCEIGNLDTEVQAWIKKKAPST